MLPRLLLFCLAFSLPLAACSSRKSFDYSPDLPPLCRSNVEFLVTCADRKSGAERDDMISRAKTMQTSQLDEVKKNGKDKANKRCGELSSIVRSNAACR